MKILQGLFNTRADITMEQAQQEKAMKDNMNFLIDLATIATGIKQNKTYIG